MLCSCVLLVVFTLFVVGVDGWSVLVTFGLRMGRLAGLFLSRLHLWSLLMRLWKRTARSLSLRLREGDFEVFVFVLSVSSCCLLSIVEGQ